MLIWFGVKLLQSSNTHRNGLAGEPPAGASLPSSLREDARRWPVAASPPLRARRRRRQAHASCAEELEVASLLAPIPLFKASSENTFGPVNGGFPRLSLLTRSDSPNVASHTAVSSFQTVGCSMRIEMRGDFEAA